jgi:hypothetical protein
MTLWIRLSWRSGRLFCFALVVLALPLKSKLRLQAEKTLLRHQLIVLRRRLQGRARFTNHDRWFLIQLYRWFSFSPAGSHNHRAGDARAWHKASFRCYWRWKSRPLGGRPQIDTELGDAALSICQYSI